MRLLPVVLRMDRLPGFTCGKLATVTWHHPAKQLCATVDRTAGSRILYSSNASFQSRVAEWGKRSSPWSMDFLAAVALLKGAERNLGRP